MRYKILFHNRRTNKIEQSIMTIDGYLPLNYCLSFLKYATFLEYFLVDEERYNRWWKEYLER